MSYLGKCSELSCKLFYLKWCLTKVKLRISERQQAKLWWNDKTIQAASQIFFKAQTNLIVLEKKIFLSNITQRSTFRPHLASSPNSLCARTRTHLTNHNLFTNSKGVGVFAIHLNRKYIFIRLINGIIDYQNIWWWQPCAAVLCLLAVDVYWPSCDDWPGMYVK